MFDPLPTAINRFPFHVIACTSPSTNIVLPLPLFSSTGVHELPPSVEKIIFLPSSTSLVPPATKVDPLHATQFLELAFSIINSIPLEIVQVFPSGE